MSSSWSDSPYWNIVLLALAWALTLSTSTLLTTVGPFSATELGASKTLSAFTIGIFLIGAAISSVPSGWLFRRYGRYCGFSLGCLLQFTGSTLGIIALATTQIEWLYMGCLSIGLAQGLGQFYRFSAVEVTPKELKSRAVTYVLSGGILAAFLGPSAANYTIHMLGDKYMGSYLMIAVFATLNQAVISLVKFPARESALTTAVPVPVTSTENTTTSSSVHHSKDMETHTHTENPLTRSTPSGEREQAAVVSAGPSKGRTRWQIVSQPQFLLSCSIATLAHTIMVMLMSNVTIAMKDSGFAFSTTSLVMEVHFFAMFCPGFVTGKLIESYGSFLVAMVGGLIFGGSSAVFASAPGQLWSYFAGMILLGVAWNLAFSAGTVMLTGCYHVSSNHWYCIRVCMSHMTLSLSLSHPSEATEVQAVNDFVLFTIAGLGSVLSGEIFSVYGWLYLVYITSALVSLSMYVICNVCIHSLSLNRWGCMCVYSHGR